MRKINIFIFLFIFFLSINLVNAVQITSKADIPDITINNTDTVLFKLTSWFNGPFDAIYLQQTDLGKVNLFSMTSSFDSSQCIGTSYKVCVWPASITGDYFVKIYGLQYKLNSTLVIYAWDKDSVDSFDLTNVSMNYAMQLINVNINDWVAGNKDAENIYDLEINSHCNDGFIATLACALSEIYPDYRELDLGKRMAYIIVTLLLLVVLIYGTSTLIFKTSPGPYTHMVTFFMVLLIFYYMVLIHYIGIIAIVTIILTLMVLTYFRIRSGFPGGN